MDLFQWDHKVKIAIGDHHNSNDYQNWEKILMAANITVENVEDKRYSNTDIHNKISKFGKDLIINSL